MAKAWCLLLGLGFAFWGGLLENFGMIFPVKVFVFFEALWRFRDDPMAKLETAEFVGASCGDLWSLLVTSFRAKALPVP